MLTTTCHGCDIEAEGVSTIVIDVHTHVVPEGLPFGHDDRFAALGPAG